MQLVIEEQFKPSGFPQRRSYKLATALNNDRRAFSEQRYMVMLLGGFYVFVASMSLQSKFLECTQTVWSHEGKGGAKGWGREDCSARGRLWFAQSARCRDEPLMGSMPKRWAALTQQVSRADLAAEPPCFCFKESCALELHQPSHYPHL